MEKPLTKAQRKEQEAREKRQALRALGVKRVGKKSKSEKAMEAEAKAERRERSRASLFEPQLEIPKFVSRSETTFNRGRREEPVETRSEVSSRSSQDLSGYSDMFSDMSRASRDLNKTLGLDRTVDIIGPDYDGSLGQIWNQLDDVRSEELQLLKSVYGVSSREQLVVKLQEQAGLRKKPVHPLMKYRQASFIHNLTANHYPCDWSRYVFPAVGNVKSTI